MELSERLLREHTTVAVVGASRDPQKAAHSVPAQLARAGFRIVPVNPHADQLLGERVFRTLRDIPFPVEIVLVFRPSPETPDVARDAVAIGAQALWLQQGIRSDDARRIAEEGGLAFVQDECSAVVRSLHGIVKR
jgi:predicted CoA-binding protein